MLAETTEQLGDANEARWLCEHASGLDGEEFRQSQQEFVTTAMAKQLHDMVRRRLDGEPLQYVMKRWAFRHLDVLVDQRVLIPRPETELLVEIGLTIANERLKHVDRPLNIVDLGTGSGVIGLSFPVFGSLQGRQLKSASSTTTEDGRRPSARLVVLTAAMSARRVTGAKFGCCSIVPIPAKESKIEGAQLNCASTSMVVTASCSICFQTAKGYRSPKSVLQ